MPTSQRDHRQRSAQRAGKMHRSSTIPTRMTFPATGSKAATSAFTLPPGLRTTGSRQRLCRQPHAGEIRLAPNGTNGQKTGAAITGAILPPTIWMATALPIRLSPERQYGPCACGRNPPPSCCWDRPPCSWSAGRRRLFRRLLPGGVIDSHPDDATAEMPGAIADRCPMKDHALTIQSGQQGPRQCRV